MREIGASWTRSFRPKIAPAKILSKRVTLVCALEEALEGVVGHVLDLAREIGSVAGLIQRLFVDVRGVDLDPLPKGRIAHHAGEHHCDGVRLLA